MPNCKECDVYRKFKNSVMSAWCFSKNGKIFRKKWTGFAECPCCSHIICVGLMTPMFLMYDIESSLIYNEAVCESCMNDHCLNGLSFSIDATVSERPCLECRMNPRCIDEDKAIELAARDCQG